MDVGGWLRSLRLDQYEANFRDNKIDADVLPQLTADDLKDIGVSAVGDRRRLLAAIAALSAPTPSAKAPASSSKPASAKGLETSAERRPITVMFCDLVGSTSLASKLDAEDWRNLVGAYLDEASSAVTGLGGHVLKKLGDGLMALFGYPQAQENDAERAVRAALAIQRALADLNARNARSGAPELSARIGIACGSVVVDAAGEVFGEVPNVAARVQATAEPGTVLVTASAQRQTAGLFVVEDKGAYNLKGVPAPVALYRIVRASGGGRRGGARALTPLVGREDELALLTRRWSRALENEGQFVQIVGEPGIGKSRLVEEFRAKLTETPHTWVEWAASQLLQNTPLHPLAEWGRLRFGGADATDDGRLADLENTLRLIGLDAAEFAPLVAPLVDIPLREDRRAKLPPEELRRRQLAAMTAWVLAGARSQPVVLAFEDLHWADPTSLDLMARLAERGAQSPLLVVATTRPEFRAPWAMRSHHGVVSLTPLDRAQVRRMVGEIASRHALSDETIDRVGERTGGVPLFVEEVTRLLLERDAQGGAQAIPPTLQQSLAARLDRLGEAREVAQIGAVLGREFSYRLLSDVSSSAAGFDEPRLQAALDRLTEADLLFVDGAPPTAAYRFKHALIQDAAYESLLKSRRQALHRRAADALLAADAEPEAIAHHFTEAGLDDLAIEWWGKAGDQALRRSAFQEAIAHLGKAIAMADAMGGRSGPEGSARPAARDRRFKLESTLAQAVGWSKGFGAEEAKRVFDRVAGAMTTDSGAHTERVAAYQGRWATNFMRGEMASAREAAENFLKAAEGARILWEVAAARRSLGATILVQGHLGEASSFLRDALELADQYRAFGAGPDPGASAAAHLSLASWMLGALDQSHAEIEEAAARAERIEHVPTQTVVRYFAAMREMLRGDALATLPLALSLIDFCRGRGVEQFLGPGRAISAWARARLEGRDRALSEFRQSLAALSEQGHRLYLPFFLGRLAEIELAEHEPDAALSSIRQAQGLAGDTGQRVFDALLHRLLGEALLASDRADARAAETAFLAAIEVSRQQSARSFGLQAALELAKLYLSTGRPADAHAVLAPALEGFSPTPAMPEIAEAQALLAELAEGDEVKADAARRQRYGNALIAARGYAAPETTEAFARARESASGDKDGTERLAADYGLWAGSFVRGELPSMRAHAAAFLSDVEARPDSPEAGVAHRCAGATCWFAGEYREARDHFERAFALFQPGRDDDLAFRFGYDVGVGAMAFLAIASWPLGEVDRAISLIDRMQTRVEELTHVGTLAVGRMHAALFELMRGVQARAAPNASELSRLSGEHDLPMWRAFRAFRQGWATGRSGAPGSGLADMRRGVEQLREQNILWFDGLLKIALAEAEAKAGDPGRAVAILDAALATCDRAGYRAFEADLHRVRGEILFKGDPASPAPAEESFLTAIAVAKWQDTRSFELRAALSLAKLYQSTGRPADAHDVLAPALEGFAPTPEMPEFTEAQAMLAALQDIDEVKADVAQRRRMTHLQAAYGAALISARGYGAWETTEAFARARESAAGDTDAPERLAADYGLWAGSYVRGELPSMRMHAAAFVRDVEARPNSPEAGIAHRVQGMTHYFAGEFVEAGRALERALALFEPGRDDDLAVRFPPDPGVASMTYLAFASWTLGEAGRAVSFIERMRARMAGLSHAPTLALGSALSAFFALMRGDRPRARESVSELARIARDHDLPLFRAFGEFFSGWAIFDGGALADGLEAMRRGVEGLRRQNAVIFDGLVKIALAEAEAGAGDPDRAIAILDEALATVDRTGYRAFEAELHRARGEILMRRDPANSAPAEEAFLTAIAVAKHQATRSFELRAALSLTKLYQSTGRPADAHAVLAPALEGFAPTPEMPEIAEAEALLTALAQSDEVKVETAQRQRLTQLHVAYGNALIVARGFAAPETTEAFAKARESAFGASDAPGRLEADYGLWAGSYSRGDLPSMRAQAAVFLNDLEAKPDSPEAGIAHRAAGATCWFAGDYREARDHLERALASFQPGRDDDLAFRFGHDAGVGAMLYLAIALWPLGDVARAIALVERAQERIESVPHIASRAYAKMHAAMFELMRGDRSRTASNAGELSRVARDHDLNLWCAFGLFLEGWLKFEGGAPGDGREDMARGAELLHEQNAVIFDGLLKIAHAQAEAGAGEPERAIAILDEALAASGRTGHRAFDAELHRARGEILLKRDPANPAPAEEAFLSAVAVAKQQATRSFELRAALSLAKLYRECSRDDGALAVLAPALEGFAPTSELPEIDEALELMAAIKASTQL